jgi:hypothetical protein
MSEVREFLENHLRPLAGPYLFVGAGLSRRYAAMPNWRDLLSYFAEKTGMPMGYYESGTLPQAASKIAEAFYEIWWRSIDYGESVIEWESKVSGDIAMPLKIEISKYLDEMLRSFQPPTELVDEFELLKKTTVDGVITTNYDSLLSLAFPTYKVYVGQDGLLFSDTQGIAEIYAIHGATSEPRSLVLTQADYESDAKRNAYLAAKLLTIFVEHPVVFMGYNFDDPDIHNILLSIVEGLQKRAVEKLQDRLIFVEWDNDAEPSVQRTQMSVGGQLLPIIRIVVPDWVEVFQALGAREHAMPARTLRILKEQVYDIIRTNDPKKRLYAYRDIDDEIAKDISIVFGVGARAAAVGIVGLTRREVWSDILENPEGEYDPISVLERLIPKTPITTYFPVFKYLRRADYLGSDGLIDPEAQATEPVKKRVAKNMVKLTTDLVGVNKMTVAELEHANGWEWLLSNALSLPSYTDDAPGLRRFLIDRTDDAVDDAWWSVQYAKAIVAYDYMKFSQQL